MGLTEGPRWTDLLHITCPPKGCWTFHISVPTLTESMPPNPTAPIATASAIPFPDRQFGYLNVYEVFPPHYPHQVFGACLAADASLQLPQIKIPEQSDLNHESAFNPQNCGLWTYDDWYGTFVAEKEWFLDVKLWDPPQNETLPKNLTISVAASTLATLTRTSTNSTTPNVAPQHNLTTVSRWKPWSYGHHSRNDRPRFFQKSDDLGTLYEYRTGHSPSRDWYMATPEDVQRGGPLRWEVGKDNGRMFVVKFEAPKAGGNGDWKPVPGEEEPRNDE